MFSRWIVTNITSACGTVYCRKASIHCGDQLGIYGQYVRRERECWRLTEDLYSLDTRDSQSVRRIYIFHRHVYPLCTHELSSVLLHVWTSSSRNFLLKLAILSLSQLSEWLYRCYTRIHYLLTHLHTCLRFCPSLPPTHIYIVVLWASV
jgi:hypothetical protein